MKNESLSPKIEEKSSNTEGLISTELQKDLEEFNESLEQENSNIIENDLDAFISTQEMDEEGKQSMLGAIKQEVTKFSQKLVDSKTKRKILTGTVAAAATAGLLGGYIANINRGVSASEQTIQAENTPTVSLVQETAETQIDPEPTERVLSLENIERPNWDENFSLEELKKSNTAVSTERIDYSNIELPNDSNERPEIFGADVVVTIDDCYSYEHTKAMFETLNERGITATFYPNTTYLDLDDQRTIELWREIYNAGFEIGYHTTDHEKNKSVAELNEDYEEFVRDMSELVGDPDLQVKTVRPPYGAWDNSWMRWVEENQLLNMRWTVGPTEDIEYIDSVMDQGYPGILILHSRSTDARWLENNVDELTEMAESGGGIVGSVHDSIQNNAEESQ